MLAIEDSELLEMWLERPLYSKEDCTFAWLMEAVRRLRTLDGQHETYCAECKKDSLFQIEKDPAAIERLNQEQREDRLNAAAAPGRTGTHGPKPDYSRYFTWLGEFAIRLRCGRNESHQIRMYLDSWIELPEGKGLTQSAFLAAKGFMHKCGQHPSIADFKLNQIDKLESAFSDSLVAEWKRAIITQAHGFNVAACVHLRRMFEGILLEARDQVDSAIHKGRAWAEFDSGRMSERVRLVAAELPNFIVQHPELYGVLSKGVHQLTEDECQRELPLLQKCMVVVAEQRLERRMREKTEEDTKRLLAEAASRLGTRT